MSNRQSFCWSAPFLLVVACGPATGPAKQDGEPATARGQDIVGGSVTSDFPAAGALTRYGWPHCTGTLVGARTVLTAAHCLDGVAPSTLKFVVGTNIAAPDAVIAVSSVTPHPGYDAAKLENDIGFVTLESDPPVPAVGLVPSMDQGWVGRELTFVGYGITSGNGGGSGNKRSVVMPIHSVGSTRFSYQIAGKNTCNGDSGGPAFAQVDGEWLVAGVTSYGDANCSYYGVDTRADTFATFVLPTPGPAAADPCQGETFIGRCDGNTVTWCENEEVKQLSCSKCGFDQASGFYNCL